MRIDYANTPNLVVMFYEMADRMGDRPFLWFKWSKGRPYSCLTWTEAAGRVTALANGLLDLGLRKGDRVVLASENRPEWAIADLAIMAAGGITAPAYVTNTVKDHLHVLNDSGARFALTSTAKLGKDVLTAAGMASHHVQVIGLETPEIKQVEDLPFLSWEAVEAKAAGRERPPAARCTCNAPTPPASSTPRAPAGRPRG